MFLLIDKPKGITSHDVVDAVRKITGQRRIGHAGTLDPNATGLLIVGIGRQATKQLGGLSKDTSKNYVAELVLGEIRDTDDGEGVILDKTHKKPTSGEVRAVIGGFKGKQDQLPPAYSAIKLKGKKAYELARKGRQVKLEPRKVEIHSIELLDYDYPVVQFTTTVSSGTYIRAIARDIGVKLGTGAYLNNLRRTKIGGFDVEKAITLDKLTRENWGNNAFDLKH